MDWSNFHNKWYVYVTHFKCPSKTFIIYSYNRQYILCHYSFILESCRNGHEHHLLGVKNVIRVGVDMSCQRMVRANNVAGELGGEGREWVEDVAGNGFWFGPQTPPRKQAIRGGHGPRGVHIYEIELVRDQISWLLNCIWVAGIVIAAHPRRVLPLINGAASSTMNGLEPTH